MSEDPPPQTVPIPLGVRTSVQQNSEGTWLVVLHFETSVMACAIPFPPEFARELARGLPKVLHDSAEAAERNASGIIPVTADLHDVMKGLKK